MLVLRYLLGINGTRIGAAAEKQEESFKFDTFCQICGESERLRARQKSVSRVVSPEGSDLREGGVQPGGGGVPAAEDRVSPRAVECAVGQVAPLDRRQVEALAAEVADDEGLALRDGWRAHRALDLPVVVADDRSEMECRGL